MNSHTCKQHAGHGLESDDGRMTDLSPSVSASCCHEQSTMAQGGGMCSTNVDANKNAETTLHMTTMMMTNNADGECDHSWITHEDLTNLLTY